MGSVPAASGGCHHVIRAANQYFMLTADSFLCSHVYSAQKSGLPRVMTPQIIASVARFTAPLFLLRSRQSRQMRQAAVPGEELAERHLHQRHSANTQNQSATLTCRSCQIFVFSDCPIQLTRLTKASGKDVQGFNVPLL